jgi:hypothetical protein
MDWISYLKSKNVETNGKFLKELTNIEQTFYWQFAALPRQSLIMNWSG